MNLGIIAASIAPLRPLFVNLGPMVQIPSDTNLGLHTSNRPFLKIPKAFKPGSKLSGIPLDSMGIKETTDSAASQGFEQVSESRV